MTRAKKTDEESVEAETTDAVPTEIPVYNANDGIHGRTGGPYLDQVEAQLFEEQQAARDGGTPDYENPRGYPGIQYNTEAQQRAAYNDTTLAGDQDKDHTVFDAPVATTVTVPVEEEVPPADDEVVADEKAERQNPVFNPDSE